MISSGFEFAAASQQSLFEVCGAFDGGVINRFRDAMKLRVGSIEQDDSPFGEPLRKQTRERSAEVFARPIASAQAGQSFRFAEQSRYGIHRELNLRTESHSSDGGVRQALGRRRNSLQGTFWSR